MASASAPAAVEFGTDELSAIDLSDAAAADAPSEADASASVSVTIKRSQFFPEGKPRLDSATSLWRAAEHGDIGRLKMLLDAGHDVNAMCEDPGWRHKTPLSAAVDGNEPLAVRLLLRRGANPDLRDGDGDRYPLHWASSFGDHDECAEAESSTTCHGGGCSEHLHCCCVYATVIKVIVHICSLNLSIKSINLEFESCCACCFGQRLDSSVIEVSASIENHLANAGLDRAFGDCTSDGSCRVRVATDFACKFLVLR